jgi:hypothetical protein
MRRQLFEFVSGERFIAIGLIIPSEATLGKAVRLTGSMPLRASLDILMGGKGRD